MLFNWIPYIIYLGEQKKKILCLIKVSIREQILDGRSSHVVNLSVYDIEREGRRKGMKWGLQEGGVKHLSVALKTSRTVLESRHMFTKRLSLINHSLITWRGQT